MQFFRIVSFAVRQNRPLIQKINVSNDVQNLILIQSIRRFSSHSGDRQDVLEKILSKIPEKPKKPLGIYIRFIKKIQPALIQEHPNAKRTEIVRMACEMYKNSDKETILNLQNEYFKDQEEYKKEMAKYNSSLTVEQVNALSEFQSLQKKKKNQKKLKRKLKELGQPKRPMNGYLLFTLNRRAEETYTGDILEVSPKLANEWKQLPDEEKNKYNAKAKELAEQYKTERNKWEASLVDLGYSDLLKKSEKSSGTSKKSAEQSDKSSKKSERDITKSENSESMGARSNSSISVENVIYSRKADAKSKKTSIVGKSNEKKYNFQSSPSSLCDNYESRKIDSKSNSSENYHFSNKLTSIWKNYESLFNGITFFTNNNIVRVVICVTFFSVFIILPLFYFFC